MTIEDKQSGQADYQGDHVDNASHTLYSNGI